MWLWYVWIKEIKIYLNCDNNSLYEQEALWWYVVNVNSETAQYFLKQPPSKYFRGQWQDSKCSSGLQCVIVLTLIGPNSLMAARYLSVAAVDCGHISVSFKLANRNTYHWSKVSCFKTSRLGPFIRIHPIQRWKKPSGEEAQLLWNYRTATPQNNIKRSNDE